MDDGRHPLIPPDVTYRVERRELELEYTGAFSFDKIQQEAEWRGVPQGLRPRLHTRPNRWTGAPGRALWEWQQPVAMEKGGGE